VSRGYGYVQRFVLEELDRRWAGGEPWVHARELAERLEGDSPTRHTCRSVRRALRLLAADGLVEIGSSAPAGGRDHAMARIALARVDEVAQRRRRRADAQELRRLLREDASERGSPARS
jgi:hypothetical protein